MFGNSAEQCGIGDSNTKERTQSSLSNVCINCSCHWHVRPRHVKQLGLSLYIGKVNYTEQNLLHSLPTLHLPNSRREDSVSPRLARWPHRARARVCVCVWCNCTFQLDHGGAERVNEKLTGRLSGRRHSFACSSANNTTQLVGTLLNSNFNDSAPHQKTNKCPPCSSFPSNWQQQ